MRRIIITSAALALLLGTSAQAADNRFKFEVLVGKLTSKARTTGYTLRQTVQVTNNSKSMAKQIKIDCGFFADGRLIASDYGIILNLSPDTTGYTDVVKQESDEPANKAECRIAYIYN